MTFITESRHKQELDDDGKPVLVPNTVLKVKTDYPSKWQDIEVIKAKGN